MVAPGPENVVARRSKLTALNDVIAEALDEIETQENNVEILKAVMFEVSSMGHFLILDKLTEVAESSRLVDKMKVVFDQACSEEKAFASLMRDLSLSLKISGVWAPLFANSCLPPGIHRKVNNVIVINLWSVVEDYRLARRLSQLQILEMEIKFNASKKVTPSKHRRLITELEAFGQRGDALRALDYMREIEVTIEDCGWKRGNRSYTANMFEDGGKTPILTPLELEDIRYKVVACHLSLMGYPSVQWRPVIRCAL
nr:phosphoenolpyruvate carboxylase-like protein [Tanacetum cinerariifolium]